MKKKPATPHPRKRKPLDAITNRQHEVAAAGAKQQSSSEAADENSSAVKRLYGAHSSVARLLEKIDTLFTGIHKTKLAEKLASDEIENFTKAMSTVELTLEDWHDFFQQVAKRPTETAPRVSNEDLMPLVPTAHKSFLSDSPLVPHGKHDFRKVLQFTPQMSPCRRIVTPVSNLKKSTPLSKKVTFANSPITITPVMPSPPKSVRLRRPSMSSSSSGLSTPSFLQSNNSDESPELKTPEAPAEIVNKYSKWLCKSPRAKQFESSPDIEVSPPKTCAFLKASVDASGEEIVSPKTQLSPFRTPGLVLRSPTSVNTETETEKHAFDLSSKFAAVSL